jgi:hypothetical protein
MLWFFERRDARLHYEIRYQLDGHGFELVITYEDGRQQIERFDDAGVLVARSRDLQNTLTASGWQPPAALARGHRSSFLSFSDRGAPTPGRRTVSSPPKDSSSTSAAPDPMM